MSSGNVITKEKMDQVVMLRESGIAPGMIPSILGINESGACQVWSVYSAVKSGVPLSDTMKRYKTMIQWACEKCGKSYADVRGISPASPAKKETEEDNTALAFASLLEAVKSLTAAVDAIDKRLSAMQMTIAGMRDDANQNTKKLAESINVNGDIATKEWRTVADKLEAIKINTKRRPWKENEQ